MTLHYKIRHLILKAESFIVNYNWRNPPKTDLIK